MEHGAPDPDAWATRSPECCGIDLGEQATAVRVERLRAAHYACVLSGVPEAECGQGARRGPDEVEASAHGYRTAAALDYGGHEAALPQGDRERQASQPPADDEETITSRDAPPIRACGLTLRITGARCPHARLVHAAVRAQSRRSLLAFNSDYVRLNLAVNRAPPESLGDGLCGGVGRFAKPRSIAGLDFISERRSLTVRNRGDPGRCCQTARRERVNSS